MEIYLQSVGVNLYSSSWQLDVRVKDDKQAIYGDLPCCRLFTKAFNTSMLYFMKNTTTTHFQDMGQ